MSELVNEVAFDLEWVVLIKQAKELGITIEEIREFLSNGKSEKNN